jgi:transposase-like protein
VVKKKSTVNKFTKAFREEALERLRSCKNVTALAEELGVHRTLLYKWRERMQTREKGLPVNAASAKLQAENRELKRMIAEKTLEIDFFRGALQKIEARRQSKDRPGEKASTTKSRS